MNITIIGNQKTNSATIRNLLVKLTESGNAVTYSSDTPANDTVDAELLESFDRIDRADLVIAVPKRDLIFDHNTTAELAYARHNSKMVFIFYG